MSNEYNASVAKAMYETLCTALDNRGWTYTRHDEDLTITYGVNGDDLPMDFILRVVKDAPIFQLFSPMPFSVPEDKRVDGAVAVSTANWGCVNGCFDYDVSDGKIMFKLTQCFRDSLIGDECIQYLLGLGCYMVDKYNDRFLALSKGIMSLGQFLEKENE